MIDDMKCKDCGEPLIAKTQPDGKVHTWHRDAPCRTARYWQAHDQRMHGGDDKRYAPPGSDDE